MTSNVAAKLGVVGPVLSLLSAPSLNEKRRGYEMNRYKLLVILMTLCVFVGGFGSAYSQPSPGTLTVHFIDVGQGNATLLAGPDFSILIDAGRQEGNEVVPYLQSVGVESLDLLVGTHPHADHIGQFPQVLSTFPVHEVWLSGDTNATLIFEQTLDAILASGAAYYEPRAGEVYGFGSATVEVLNPVRLTGELHEDSLVLRVIFGNVAFLFPGDAEAETEMAMIRQGRDLRSQILELGHHGSATSSSLEFLQVVQPEVAIYSVGQDNPYGHPASDVLDRLAGLGIAVYGTDQYGSIQVITDGQTYRIQSSQGEIASPSGSIQAVATPTLGPATGEGCREGQIDVNTASKEELDRIINIGPVRAAEMIRLRPFSSVDDLIRIRGIGPQRLDDIKAQGLACVQSTRSPTVVQPTQQPPTPAYVCDCGKTCSQITSCEEAYFQLQQCGCGRRDGDGDGVPCEDICPGG
jgi:competence protein ComEC